MYNHRKVHDLLFELPANTVAGDVRAMKDFYFALGDIGGSLAPAFCCDVFCSILGVKNHSRGSSFLGLPSDLPPHLVNSIINAMAYAFSSENGKNLIKSYRYIFGLDAVTLKRERPQNNDAIVLTALFDVLCPNDGVGQALGMCADEYDLELAQFLVEAFQKRHFLETEVSQIGQSELSSVLKKYFKSARTRSSRWKNISTILKSIYGLVGNEGVFWGPPLECRLERVLANEFSFKAFNCFLPEERARMLATFVN